MKKIAEYLRTQAEALTAMADADNLKGKYADELAENARGLGRKLDLAEDRYREVKGHLSNWADELEDLQKRADKALRDAQEAQRTIESRSNSDDHSSDDKKKKDEKNGSDEDPILKQAKEDLAEAHKLLNSAEGSYQERSDHFARKIRSSINDDMKDSWWNNIKGWVADADWLGDIADWASWAATVVGAVAIFFPALGVIALALTAVVATIHIAQAVTGNGSWFDVVMDLGALKLARNGMKAAKAIKALQQNSRKAASGLAKEGSTARAAQANAGARKTAARAERKRGGGTSRGNRERARARRLRLEGENRAAGKRAADEVRDADMPQITANDKVRSIGDENLAKQIKDINKWRDTYPNSTELASNASQAQRHADAVRGSWTVATGLDVADKGADSMTDDGYSRMKDRMTAPVGSQW
ncbi:hypothetical protein LRR80_04837 [Streptomyces sp. RO-S4]|uniref:hypothetical protein n=1 Tax=Streptomyces sp. RO-S4 TaxID=2902486 RepID=UPI00208FDDEE|nr:hypothetical protein [Streptomyces sp. RO-S4]MCO4698749.1 hypothetical protein [Streptomyces sp. RO-S4]